VPYVSIHLGTRSLCLCWRREIKWRNERHLLSESNQNKSKVKLIASRYCGSNWSWHAPVRADACLDGHVSRPTRSCCEISLLNIHHNPREKWRTNRYRTPSLRERDIAGQQCCFRITEAEGRWQAALKVFGAFAEGCQRKQGVICCKRVETMLSSSLLQRL